MDKKHHIPVPSPLPPPLPGGGPQTGYQFKFNERYSATRRAELQPFFYGRPGSQPGTELTPDERTALADKLYDQSPPPVVNPPFGPTHVDFDQEIDYWGQDPYTTMYMREVVYGYQRVPIGTGATAQPPNVVKPGDLQGPPEAGKYLLVTCNINQL